jgi:hypothetical protein
MSGQHFAYARARLRRWLLSSRAAWFGLALSACVDPAGRYDEFVERQEKARQKPDAGGFDLPDGSVELPDPEQLNGTYLYVVSFTGLSPEQPTVYELEVTAEREGDTYTLNMRERPLAIADRKTPVGEWGPWQSHQVTPQGSYETPELTFVVPGAANVLGSETTALIVFRGNVGNARLEEGPEERVEFFCGDVSGRLTKPIMLPIEGTFTATRITDPDNYPKAVINCAGDPAKEI